MVQSELGMTKGFAFDIQAVCAGFVFALSNASALIVSGQAKRVLIIGAETFSRILDWEDRATCVLFGDGAGALVLEAAEGKGTNEDRGVLATDLNSDGRHKDILYVDGGVSTQSTGHLRMQGKEVFRHAVEKLAQTADTALEKLGLSGDDVDWIVPHQANLRIISQRQRNSASKWIEWWSLCRIMAIRRLLRFPLPCPSASKERPDQTRKSCGDLKQSAADWPGDRWFFAGNRALVRFSST